MSLARTNMIAPRLRSSPTVSRTFIRQLSSTSPVSSSMSSSPSAAKLDWPTYLALRRSQRLYGLFATIPTTFAGLTLGASYFATIEAEPTETIMGIEPIYVYAAATFACVGAGYLMGPVFGSGLWRVTHGKVRQAMELKDKDFYAHIVRNRVDPSRQSVSNPVPDYYAEKVSSLSGYRRWLRDQAAYRRKATFGDGADASL